MKQAVPWYFPSKIIWLYVPNWRCTSRILIWENDIRISCFPFFPLGFFTNMNLFNKESVIFLAVRNASATFRYISHYRWNRPCHGDFSSLMWLSTTWCDLSISPLWHGDEPLNLRVLLYQKVTSFWSIPIHCVQPLAFMNPCFHW